jgi:DNA-binding transcriptional regulator YhcF (GntR family)
MQELNGYIKLFRKLVRWGWYQDSAVKDLFLHCLLMASFKDFEWLGKGLKAGQFVTSFKRLSEDLGFSVQQIRTALKKLESTGELTSTSTNKFTIITVNKWEDYQSDEELSNIQSNNPITNEQQTDIVNKLLTVVETMKKSTSTLTSTEKEQNPINKGLEEIEKILSTSTLTNEQQTDNKRATNEQQHRKNIKKNKKIKNSSNNARARVPQLSEILSFISKQGLNVDGEKFYKKYSENGWITEEGKPITDWKKLLQVWDRKELRDKPTYQDGYSGVKSLLED